MEKNAWHVSKQVAAKVDDAPVLKEYTNGRLSETAEKLFILNFYVINCCWNALENSKSQVPGAAYFRLMENFIDEHYIPRCTLFISVAIPAKRKWRTQVSVPGVSMTDGWDQKLRGSLSRCLTNRILIQLSLVLLLLLPLLLFYYLFIFITIIIINITLSIHLF